MKRWLCALLALALCLFAALAEGEAAGEAPAEPATAAEAAQESREAPEPEPQIEERPQPEEKPKPEATPEPGEGAEFEQGAETPAADASEEAPEPEATPEPEPTEAPEVSDEPGEGGEPEAGAPAPADALPDDGEESGAPAPEGYVLAGGERREGTLAELLAEPGEKTIYVTAAEPVKIPDFKLALLKNVTLLPDPDLYPGDRYAVVLRDGAEEIFPEDIEAAVDEVVMLTVAVEKKPGDPGTEPTDPPAGGEVAIHVEPRQFAGNGVWQCEIPEFALSGIPEGGAGYSYVAIVYDERFIPLSGDSYLPLEEGVYAVRFAILDERGDVVNGASDRYELWLDYTPPELVVEVSAARDYTMTLSGSDALSGVVELTLDGGETWTSAALGDGLSVVHTEPRRKAFPPGTIGIRDAAGNASWNETQIVLDKLPPVEPMSFGGYGGGSPSATAAPHASGDGDDAPYDAYELALPEGPVDALTLGGEQIDLGLELPGGAAGRFTAELTSWAAKAPAEDEDPPKDTLVLRAAAGDDPQTYTWRINGAVLRKLYNTDIQYLALAAGDAMLALPTVGFAAGTRYAELKMAGVSTAEFEYEIVMRVGPDANIDPGMSVDPETGASTNRKWNLCRDCAVELYVEVAGERYDMIGREATPEMYPVDVCCGPEDLPDYPYGAYPGAETEG